MKLFLLSILLLIFLSSCERCGDPMPNNFIESTVCVTGIFVDNSVFDNAPADEFFFLNAAIDGDCLVGTLQYGGGCEEVDILFAAKTTHDVANVVSARISLDDDDTCEALVTHDFSYELTGLQITGSDFLTLDLQGFDGVLTYNY